MELLAVTPIRRQTVALDLMAVMMPEMEEQKATRARINGANFFLDKPISDYDLHGSDPYAQM